MKKVKLIWNNYPAEEILTIDNVEETQCDTIRLYLKDLLVAEYNKLLVTLVIIQDQ
jgi:hypothetical protein